MSDFGAIIYISKKDKSAFSMDEIDQIKTLSQKIGSEINLKNSMGKPYLFEVGLTTSLDDSKCYTVNVLLSDYYGDSTDFKWHKKVEVADSKVIGDKFSKELEGDYKVKPSFEWW